MKKRKKKSVYEKMTPSELAALVEKKAAGLHHKLLGETATKGGVHKNKTKYTRKKRHKKKEGD